MEQRAKTFLPALEGIRGYAFLVVFLVHFHQLEVKPAQFWLWPYFLLTGIGWLVVPIFFALSGYLITGILYDTKGRQGYFKVFYGRRSLRVFPLYYLALLLVAIMAACRHWYWNAHYFAYLFYVQNFTNSAHIFNIGKYTSLGHLWSLAVEEHFYLAWPVVIWLCPDRKSMLRVCYGILVACFAMRLCWPLFHGSMMAGYWSTFTRTDGIVGGAMLALVERGQPLTLKLTRGCSWIAAVGVLLLAAQTAVSGTSMPMHYLNLVCMTPLANLVAVAVLVLLLAKETVLSRLCSRSWICSLGRLSYGLYVFHNLYLDYFSQHLAQVLRPHLGRFGSQILSASLAFLLTWVLAKLSYQFLEGPAMRIKEVLTYGPLASPQVAIDSSGWAVAPFRQTVRTYLRRSDAGALERRTL